MSAEGEHRPVPLYDKDIKPPQRWAAHNPAAQFFINCFYGLCEQGQIKAMLTGEPDHWDEWSAAADLIFGLAQLFAVEGHVGEWFASMWEVSGDFLGP